jgi:asparaginyl-tRNA synthetase
MYKQKYTDIKKIISSLDKDITVCGWVKTCRISGSKDKRLAFIKLSDGSCIDHLQIVCSAKDGDFEDLFKRCKTGVSIEFYGKIVKSMGKGQSLEMQAKSYDILGDCDETFPIQKVDFTMDFLRKIPHLKSRSDVCASILRIKSVLKLAVTEFYDKIGFCEV